MLARSVTALFLLLSGMASVNAGSRPPALLGEAQALHLKAMRLTPSASPDAPRLGRRLLTALRGGAAGSALKLRPSNARLIAGTYTVFGLSVLTALVTTIWKHPLWPFQMESLEWTRAWLITTIGDYYGACFALCAVILASESRWAGIAWSLGCCLLGAPVCCSWVVSRVLRKGTLALRD